MARPEKSGISYFPLDVDFMRDIKIKKIMRAHGPISVAILIDLLGNIYGDEGYYMRWDDDMAFLVADEVGAKEDSVCEVVKKALQVDFFDKDLFDNYNILTSKGIQERYLKATERRVNVNIEQAYSLHHVDIMSTERKQDVRKSTQSKVNKSKVNKSKVNQTKEPRAEIHVNDLPFIEPHPVSEEEQLMRTDFEKLWTLYPKKSNFDASFTSYRVSIRNGATNKQIQTGIVNYIKHIKLDKLDYQYIKLDVNFFKHETWKNHQEDPSLISKARVEPLPDFLKTKDEKPEHVHETDEEVSPEKQAEIRAKLDQVLGGVVEG